MTKTYRQGQILKLIRGKRITTQDELAEELKNQGIAATQVTLSRDIRDLRLVKTRKATRRWRRKKSVRLFPCWPRSFFTTCSAPKPCWC